jgi:prephenate dehydrogenase
MTARIAMIGLDKVSISTAMALQAKHAHIKCSGWDPDAEKRIASDQYHAFHPLCKKLKEAVKDAAVVMLALAPHDLGDVLKDIKDLLEPGMVLVNLSPLHVPVARMVEESLGSDTHFVSMLPGLNPDLVGAPEDELESAREDLFTGSSIYISAPSQAQAVVLDLAIDLAVLLGGQPLMADPYEVDGLSAAYLSLPELTAAILMQTAGGQPSWQEGRRLAGQAMAQGTAPLDDKQSAQWAQSLLSNRENLARLLDDFGANVQRVKKALLAQDEEALADMLEEDIRGREEWLLNKGSAGQGRELATSIPTEKQALERILKLGN